MIDPDPMDAFLRKSSLALALFAATGAFVAAAPPQDPVSTVQQPAREMRSRETTHYELRAWSDPDELRAYAEILEQTWPAIQDELRATPKLESGEKLRFRIYADKDAWLKGSLDDQQSMPKSADPAWFSPRNRTIYMYRHESAVYTRMMIVYAAVLQFHGLCKGKNADLDTTWFVHGLAQTLAVHRWDGSRIELGVTPRLCVIDYPARALEALGGPKFELDTQDEEKIANPYASWAAVSYVLHGAGGKLRSKFQKLALGHSGSKLSGKEFLREMGFDRNVRKDFREWLLAEQYVLEIAQGDWEEAFDRSLIGGRDNAGSDLSVALLRPPRAMMRGRAHGLQSPGLQSPGSQSNRPMPGLMLSWQDGRTNAHARFAPPLLVVEYLRDGKVVDLREIALPNPTSDVVDFEMRQLEFRASPTRKQIDWLPGGVGLTLDGKDFGRIDVMEGRMGLASYAGRSRFSNIVIP